MAEQGNNNDKTQSHVILGKGTMVSHYRIVEKIGTNGTSNDNKRFVKH